MASGFSNLSELQRHNRQYGANQKPPKINLINEQPRRDSIDEQQLETKIKRLGSQTLQNQSVNYETRALDVRMAPYTTGRNSMHQSNAIPDPPPRTVFETNFNRQKILTQKDETKFGLSELDSLTRELAQKEAKLRREIAYTNTYKNPWSQPKQIREPRREPVVKRDRIWQKDVPFSPRRSRPDSQASTEADLMDKTSQLLREVEEIQRKEIIDQPIVLDPRGSPKPAPMSPAGTLTKPGMKTAVIKVPTRDFDNKSPLPFSFDNFSTLGVRGNVASVGAAEPEKPYPPIFPLIKRTPSPLPRTPR